jgi:chromosomal replication initiator protein
MTQVLSLWRGMIKLQRSGPTMAEIVAEVAKDHGLTVEDLKGRALRQAVSWPRQIAMAKMRLAGKSTTQIGKFFDDRDHSTVVHACRRFEQRQAETA